RQWGNQCFASVSMMASGGDEYAAEQFKLKELIQYAVTVVSSLPILIPYPFVQKYFVKGVMIGSVKG
ncbi:MAG: carbohydrate ABC transporter permease, partial [Clostridia bacterium]